MKLQIATNVHLLTYVHVLVYQYVVLYFAWAGGLEANKICLFVLFVLLELKRLSNSRLTGRYSV